MWQMTLHNLHIVQVSKFIVLQRVNCHNELVFTPCPEKKDLSFPWITLTNLNVILQFLAHIILKVRFTKNVKSAFEIYFSLCSVDVIMTSSKMPFLLYPRWTKV